MTNEDEKINEEVIDDGFTFSFGNGIIKGKERFNKNKIIGKIHGVVALLCIAVYLLLCLIDIKIFKNGSLWGGNLFVFIAIPLTAMFTSIFTKKTKIEVVKAIVFFLVCATYIVLSFMRIDVFKDNNPWANNLVLFIIVPVVSIFMSIFTKHGKKEIIKALVLFLTVVAYLLMGFLKGLWHPGWIVFFIIPIVDVILK